MAEEPVEILVQMAERGEIDPWNIDIVEVTDRFLSELGRRKELDLRISGRTLFYAATLLRMKSEHLEQLALDVDLEFSDDMGEDSEDEFRFDINGEESQHLGPVDRLEREIKRRLERKEFRRHPVTLYELITELKNAEKEERRRQRLRSYGPDEFYDAEDIVSIAHEERYQESALHVLEACRDCSSSAEGITLAELTSRTGWTVPEVYIPLLFLMFEGDITLEQEDFFGELFILPVARTSESAP
ncbi:MAG TPA: ScpA family protein [Methanoregulaceae archaeon]|nr:ScpA family protein [Methanoregulaceae archaeon]